MGVFLLGVALAQGQCRAKQFLRYRFAVVLCSPQMGRTSNRRYRIIKTVGMDMVKLQEYQGFATDLAATGCLLFSSLLGIPVSTTHVKTTAIMGVGSSRGLSRVRWDIVRELALAWILTFPGCGIIGFLMAKLFINIF